MALQELTILPGENATVTIVALPTALGALEDKVVCQVVSSPELIEFGITCMGAKPQVDLQLADCPAEALTSQQQGSKKKGPAARDRSKSPAKGPRAGSKQPAGDENATSADPDAKPDAKKAMTKVRRPSSTSLKARPGTNQQEASMPPRPASSASPAALPRGRGTPSRAGIRPSSTRSKGLPSPGTPNAKKPTGAGDAANGAAGAEASTKVSEPAATAMPKAKGDAAASDAGAGKTVEAAKASSTAAAGKGKKGGPAVPEPLAISLEADQGPLEGIAQVRTGNSSCEADLIHNGATDAKSMNHEICILNHGQVQLQTLPPLMLHQFHQH